jgi:hypothetical protein
MLERDGTSIFAEATPLEEFAQTHAEALTVFVPPAHRDSLNVEPVASAPREFQRRIPKLRALREKRWFVMYVSLQIRK